MNAGGEGEGNGKGAFRHEYQEAAKFYDRSCASYPKVLGIDHPVTRACSQQYSSVVEEMKACQPPVSR